MPERWVPTLGIGVSRKLLQNVKLTMHSGEVVAIMGESGAGKTTLMDLLAARGKQGELHGSITVNGCDIFKTPSYKRIIGYVYQDDLLMETLTVRENVLFSARMRVPKPQWGPNESALQHRVDAVLQELDIAHVAHTHVGKASASDSGRGISGGERRRAAIAMEVVVRPNILFLDEPTSGLDSHNALRLVNRLRRLAHKNGCLVIMSIHQPSSDIFTKHLDRVVLLKHGSIVVNGAPQEVQRFFERQMDERFPANDNPADVAMKMLKRWNIEHAKLDNQRSDSDEEDDDDYEMHMVDVVVDAPASTTIVEGQ
jgi:ABC-type multidrug transport system ATPase subunit